MSHLVCLKLYVIDLAFRCFDLHVFKVLLPFLCHEDKGFRLFGLLYFRRRYIYVLEIYFTSISESD